MPLMFEGWRRRREARRAWLSVPIRQRKEVIRLAKAGETHPDVELAQLASRWAGTVLRTPIAAHYVGSVAFLIIVVIVISLLAGAQQTEATPGYVGAVLLPLIDVVVGTQAREDARAIAQLSTDGGEE